MNSNPSISSYMFHSSSIQGLEMIKPMYCLTHHKSWIYATSDLVMAAPFLSSKGGDDFCSIGKNSNGKPFIREKFSNSFFDRYANIKGSIYLLPGDSFLKSQTNWNEEFVSEEIIKPIQELRIESVITFLHKLRDLNLLEINLYD